MDWFEGCELQHACRIFSHGFISLRYTAHIVWLQGRGLTVDRRTFFRHCWRFYFSIIAGTAVAIDPAVPNSVRNRVDSESAPQLQGLD